MYSYCISSVLWIKNHISIISTTTFDETYKHFSVSVNEGCTLKKILQSINFQFAITTTTTTTMTVAAVNNRKRLSSGLSVTSKVL